MEWQSISMAMPKRLRVVSSMLGQRGVKRPIEPFDALECGTDGQPLAVDLLGVGNDAGNRAKAPDHPRRLGVGKRRQPALKQLGIKLIGLAINVEIGAREAGRDQGSAERHHGLEQLIHIAVFRLAQGHRVEPGGLQESLGIDPARVRRAEHHRR